MKPRILFIGPYPPPYSGPELGMKLFLESSLKMKYNIRFVKTNFRQTNVNKGKFGLAMVFGFFTFFSRLMISLARHRPELVYYPITPTQVGWLGRDTWCILFCRLFGARVVAHLRGSHFRLNVAKFHPLTQCLVAFACRRLSGAIVQADCLHDQFTEYLDQSNIFTLYQAIDTAEYDNPDVTAYEPGCIAFLGHMTQAKGFCDLLRATEYIVASHPEANFYFCGTLRKGERGVFFNQVTGEPLKYENPIKVREQVLRGPARDHLHFLGVVKGSDKLDLLRRADFVVLPSYSEGFSRALLEAVSMGKPIVFTPVGAHREVFHDGQEGVCVQPGDVDELIRALAHLLDDRKHADRIRHSNYQRTRREFDIEIIAGRLMEIFEDCLAKENGLKCSAR